MSEYGMREALYALPRGVIAKRRKTVAVPLLLLAAGVAMSVANGILSGSAHDADPRDESRAEAMIPPRGGLRLARLLGAAIIL